MQQVPSPRMEAHDYVTSRDCMIGIQDGHVLVAHNPSYDSAMHDAALQVPQLHHEEITSGDKLYINVGSGVLKMPQLDQPSDMLSSGELWDSTRTREGKTNNPPKLHADDEVSEIERTTITKTC